MFTEQDTEAALEYVREKALTCSGCGHPRDETMAIENHDRYTAKAYVCHACAARDRAAHVRDNQPSDDSGLMWAIEEIEG